MTSVKVKFRKSTIKNREGVLYFQLIHNRKTKLITTRFRLHPHEWNARLSSTATLHKPKSNTGEAATHNPTFGKQTNPPQSITSRGAIRNYPKKNAQSNN